MISIASSSYLLNNHDSWKNLRNIDKTNFSDYGNFLNLFLNKKDSTKICVIFIEDIIESLNIKKLGMKILEKVTNFEFFI